MRIFAVELRRTWLFWAIPPLTALWLWMMLTRTGAWKGTWTGATTYADTPASYAVIALCAIIGSASAQRRKNGFYAYLRTSSRSPLTVFGVRLLVILILSFIPFVVAFAVAWTINVPRAPHGFFYLGYAAYAALSLAAALTLADLVGLVTPSPVVGAVAGAAIGLISSFYGDIPLSVAPDLEMSPGQIRLSLGLAITCVCAALLLPALRISARRPVTDRIVSAAAVLVIAGALLVTFNVSSFAGPPLVDRAAPAHPTCSNSRPQVCVWPDQAAYLPELVTFARRASAAGTGVFPVPGVFHEFALTGNRDLTYSFVVLAQGPGLWSTAGGMADTMLNSAFLPRYCPAATAEDDARQTVQLSNLAYWLQARTYGGEYPHQFAGSRPDTTTVDHILTSSQADQKRWARITLAQALATPCAKTSAS